MKKNEETNERIHKDNQQSLQISHNQTLTNLVQQQSKQKININNQSHSLQEISHSRKELFKQFQTEKQQKAKKNVVIIEPQKLHIQSQSQKKNIQPPLSPAQDYTKMYTSTFNRQQKNRQFPIMRAKTMIQGQKKYQQSSQTIKHKLPQTILSYITSQAKLKRLPSMTPTKTQTGKKLGQMGLSRKLTMKYNTKKCQICETQAPQKQFQRMTKSCEHSFCSSCLHHYVIYKINAFEAVQCPCEGCNQPLDQQCQLYQQLPLQVRKKYKKLLQYEMVKQHPNRKMCPQENCQGWIDINEALDPICSKCQKIYCAKCLLPHHEGDCENKQLQFFQGTLHYRQCSKCKNVIQKSSGCIHMTCRCGYQFCYLCGAKWNHSHVCKNPDQQRLHQQQTNCCCCYLTMCDFDCDDCCDNFLQGFCDICCVCCENRNDECCNCLCDCCGCDCECSCCDLDNCPAIRCLLEFIFRAFIFILWITLVFPVTLMLDFLLMGMFWIFITFVSGMTMYTIEIISEQQGFWFVASIIFYPVTAMFGIALAFRQVFTEIYISHIVQVAQTFGQFFHQFTSGD